MHAHMSVRKQKLERACSNHNRDQELLIGRGFEGPLVLKALLQW